MLYTVACGSPVAGHIGQLVALAHDVGWQVAVIATPDGRKFLDQSALAAQTGYPVRSEFKQPEEPDVLPAPDAILVAPATVNTVNKWAGGAADTLALGLLIESYGLGLPVVVVPYTNTAMASHPSFHESIRRLRTWGVRVLFGEEVALPTPGAGSDYAGMFPWRLALASVGPPRAAGSVGGGAGETPREERLSFVRRNRREALVGWGVPVSSVPRPVPTVTNPQ